MYNSFNLIQTAYFNLFLENVVRLIHTCSNPIILIITKTCPCNIKNFFSVVKFEKNQKKIFDIFLIFAQNIDCGYTLEPPRRGGSNEYPQSMF